MNAISNFLYGGKIFINENNYYEYNKFYYIE